MIASPPSLMLKFRLHCDPLLDAENEVAEPGTVAPGAGVAFKGSWRTIPPPTLINVIESKSETKRFFDLIFWPLLRITFTSFINR